MQKIIQQISQESKIQPSQIQSVLQLLENGNSIPFIARYRKEQTGSLDEVQIYDIQQRYTYVEQLSDRKAEVLRLIDEQEKLTDELSGQIEQATTLQQVDDLYAPYRKRRRTLATIAQENGLQPLADWLLTNLDPTVTPEEKAQEFITKEVEDVETALKGSHEIIAQYISDNAQYREFIRKYVRYNAELVVKEKDVSKDPRKTYQLYYDFSLPVNNARSYQVLAINRGEREDVLSVSLKVDVAPIMNYMTRRTLKEALPEAQKDLIVEAIEDSYRRFIGPAIEREIRNELTDQADEQAINVFSENLRHLLLQPPLKGQIVLGFDPAFRTGCKLAVTDATGQVLDISVIFPHPPASKRQREQAGPHLSDLIEKYQVDVIAIGNGTASRESEKFVADVIAGLDREVKYIVIDEAGASVYSASKIGREEFPDLAVEERSAASIARRLQDPLAELIKIDPKSLGIGQYQHDVTQKRLDEQLDFMVDVTVNQVGVDVNTASVPLLQHVSGVSAAVAKNIVEKREEIGRFDSRKQIKDVKRLGPKSFEQSAGFLRILGGNNPLDQTGIHPESYQEALKILELAGVELASIGSDEATQKLEKLSASELSQELEMGQESVEDIIEGLMNPLADIRDGMSAPILRSDVLSMNDLEIGMKLEGVVRNVVDFGAFVDIGVGQDGLIHISQLSKRRKRNVHPSELIAVGDIVEVEVVNLEKEQNRIGLKRL